MLKTTTLLALMVANSSMANQNLPKPGFVKDNNAPMTANNQQSTRQQGSGLESEGFDDVSNLPGWVIDNQSSPVGTNSWFQGLTDVFNAQSGPDNSYIAANFNSTGGTDICNYLILPDLGYLQTLSFWTRTSVDSQFPDRLLLLHSPSGGINTGDCVNGFGDFSNTLREINPNLNVGGYPEDWTAFSNQIDATGRVALVYYVTDGGSANTNSNYIGIDNVQWLAGFPDADLAITKTNDAPAGIVTGENVTYQLNIVNNGPGDGANTTIVDNLPSQVEYVSNNCGAVFDTGVLTWVIDSFANGASESCEIVTTVITSGTISNTATISADEIDNITGNNTSTTTFTAGAPTADLDLIIINSATGRLNTGDTVNFTQSLSNNGPQNATNTTVIGTIPSGLDYESNSCGATLSGSTLSWDIGDLINSSSVSCTIQMTVSGFGRLEYQAVASADQADNVNSNNINSSGVNGPARIIPSVNFYGLLILGITMLLMGFVYTRNKQ